MSTFKIQLQDPKAYLHAIAGLTKLTPKESDILGEIIKYMQINRLKVLDDNVKNHVMIVADYNHPQCYYNLINKLKKRKLLLYARKKMELKPILLPGTVLEISLHSLDQESALKQFTEYGEAVPS